jgi:hypothetical protein
MRLVLAKKAVVAIMASLATIAYSFTAPQIRHPPTRTRTTRTLLAAKPPVSSPQQHHDDQGEQPKADLSKIFYQFVAGFALTTTLWTAVPAMDLQSFVFPTSSSSDSSRPPLLMAMTAHAKEMASGSGSRVNKDPESLLRYGLPISNKEVSACVRAALLFFPGRFCFGFVSSYRVVGCWNHPTTNHQELHATL